MVASDFTGYFAASAGAGAALLGLIFVAVSIVSEQPDEGRIPFERQTIAASAYSALINAFFISLASLLPGHGAGYAILVISLLSVYSSLTRGILMFREPWLGWVSMLRRIFLVVVGIAFYSYEVSYAIRLLQNPDDIDALTSLASILLGVYGIGVARAWQLVGWQHGGLSGLINPLNILKKPNGTQQKPQDNVQPPAPSGKIPSSPAPTLQQNHDIHSAADASTATNAEQTTPAEIHLAPKPEA